MGVGGRRDGHWGGGGHGWRGTRETVNDQVTADQKVGEEEGRAIVVVGCWAGGPPLSKGVIVVAAVVAAATVAASAASGAATTLEEGACWMISFWLLSVSTFLWVSSTRSRSCVLKLQYLQ
jgi:hypothetical protein